MWYHKSITRRGYSSIAKRLANNKKDKSKKQGSRKNNKKRSHNEKESRQSPQYLLNEFNSFSLQDVDALMEYIVREPVLQSTSVFPVGFMHYQSPLFSESQAAKTPGRHILGGFSIKWVAGTTVSSCYGCCWAIVNPPMLPEHAFCIAHWDVSHYNHPVIQDYQK